MKKPASFTRLGTTADGVVRRLARGDEAWLWLCARWGSIVGEPLSRKIVPASLAGRRLTISLLDPAWRKPVEATLPDLEARLAIELPELRPKVILK